MPQDAIVIGAGIVGAACAFRLAERGLRVTVLEAADAPATGSTGRSAAGVRVQFSRETNVRLSYQGILEYRDFQERYGLPSGYRPQGYLFLVDDAAWPAHDAGLQVQRRVGVPVQVLNLEEARRLVPFAPDGLRAATFGPLDGVVDPHALTMGYLTLARRHGAVLRTGAPVTAAHASSDGGWRLTTSNAHFEAPLVVNAAGAWAGRVAALAGLPLPVEPVRRSVWLTGPLDPQVVASSAGPHGFPLTVDVPSGTWLRSEGERLLIGRSRPDEPPGLREGVDWDWLEPTLEVALPRFPFLADAGLDRRGSWWGYYETTPDHDAILGRHPHAEGWLDAAGFSGHGVQHAAMVARLIAEEAVDGRASSVDLTPLRHDRFLGGGSGETPGEGRERHVV